MYSCQDTAELREDELRRCLNDQPLLPCPTSRSMSASNSGAVEIPPHVTVTYFNRTEGNAIDNEFMDPGLWLTTLISISVTIVFAFISAVFAIINIVFNPIEPILRYFIEEFVYRKDLIKKIIESISVASFLVY